MNVWLACGTFCLGVFIAFLIEDWRIRLVRYTGTIVVTKHPEKTLISLELDDDPELLEYKKTALFKVRVSDD